MKLRAVSCNRNDHGCCHGVSSYLKLLSRVVFQASSLSFSSNSVGRAVSVGLGRAFRWLWGVGPVEFKSRLACSTAASVTWRWIRDHKQQLYVLQVDTNTGAVTKLRRKPFYHSNGRSCLKLNWSFRKRFKTSQRPNSLAKVLWFWVAKTQSGKSKPPKHPGWLRMTKNDRN